MAKERHNISDERRAEMFSAFCEQQSVNYVAKKTGVHYNTCKRYRELDCWDARAKEKERRTADAIVTKHVDSTVRTISIVDAAINVFASSLIGTQSVTCPHCQRDHRVRIPTAKITASEFERLIHIKAALTDDGSQHQDKTLTVNHVHMDKSHYAEAAESE